MPVAVFALTAVRGSSSDPAAVNRIVVDANAKLMVLSLEIAGKSSLEAYAVSLKDRAGRSLWSGVVPPFASEFCDVAIDPALVPIGSYVLEIGRRVGDNSLTCRGTRSRASRRPLRLPPAILRRRSCAGMVSGLAPLLRCRASARRSLAPVDRARLDSPVIPAICQPHCEMTTHK
ncbi:MAG: hypothetical protein JWL71_4274 [Acidobacteria bacterium]|nr:hypothetical protein [Acidobacteriota bacterium]